MRIIIILNFISFSIQTGGAVVATVRCGVHELRRLYSPPISSTMNRLLSVGRMLGRRRGFISKHQFCSYSLPHEVAEKIKSQLDYRECAASNT